MDCKLEEIDDILASYEDWMHGINGEQCTKARKILIEVQRQLKITVIKSLPSDEEIREPIQNALYSTDRLTTDQCTELADGILTYLNEAGYKVVRQ